MDIHLFEEKVRRSSSEPIRYLGFFMEDWRLVSWDPAAKKYVPDTGAQAQLRNMGRIHGIEEAPPIYRGRIPSPEAIRYCAKLQREHEEWEDRRAYLTSDVE